LDFRVRCERMRYLQRDAKASAGSLFIRSDSCAKIRDFRVVVTPLRVVGRRSRHGRLRQASAPKRAVRGARTSGWVEVGRLRYPEGERGVFSARRASSRGPSVPREQGAPSFWSRKKRQRGRFSFPRGVEIARSKGSPDEHRRAQARLLERIQLGGRHGGCIHPARHSSRARPARHTRRSGYDG
jgi:hypothetical protein